MLFGRLKIRTRLYAGFTSLIIVGVAVAAVGVWGIGGMGEQTARMNTLNNKAGYVAAAIEGEDLIARILLGARNEPSDDMKAAFHQAQDHVRAALTLSRGVTFSAKRQEIYNGVLGKLDAQAQSADKSFDMGRAMVDARGRLFSGDDALTTATTRLLRAVSDAEVADADAAAAAAVIERTVLLVGVANWRFLATKDPKGPATFARNVETAQAAIDSFDQQKVKETATIIPQLRAALAAYREAFDVTAPALLGLAEAYDTVQRPDVTAIQSALGEAAASLSRDVAEATATSVRVRGATTDAQIVVAGLGLVSGILLAWFIGRGIARPISSITSTMKTLAAGNQDVSIVGLDGRDEIGDMARAVEVFKTGMIEAKRLAADQESARTARALRQDAMDRHTEAFGKSVTAVMSALGDAADNMRRSADVMTESAAAVRSEASETAGGAGKSSADLTAVAAAVEQFTASVGEISRQVAVASNVAAQAVTRAEASQGTIRGLADSTARIGDVVRLIDSIAGQTNLLALNATIEAARAGDAGKGFAVVAGEVKALAAQTAKATAEINAQIETVRGATEETVAAMNEIGDIIGHMGEISTAISAAVEEQSVTTREIASSIQGVAGSTAQAAEAMENVVHVADRSGEASRKIEVDAGQIGAESKKLRHEVETFLRVVQADSGERRRSERIVGGTVTATLRMPGMVATKVTIQDISRSSIALHHSGAVTAGQDLEVELADAGGPVTGRVVRASGGVVAIVFSDKPENIARVDRVLAKLSAHRDAA